MAGVVVVVEMGESLFGRPGDNMFNVPQSPLDSFDDPLPLLPHLDVPMAINPVQLLHQPVGFVLVLVQGIDLMRSLGEADETDAASSRLSVDGV